MKQHIQQQAEKALLEGDYTKAARIWVQANALPQNINELKSIFKRINSLLEKTPHPDLYAILGLIALDYNEVFDANRESALIECVQWSKQGLEIDPGNYNCNRHAGSALYWLGNLDAATGYYKKAAALCPSPVLQIRLFNLQNQGNPNPDFATLSIDTEPLIAMEAYNAGVEINYLLEQYSNIPTAEVERLTLLKQQCYGHAHRLYHGAVVQNNGDFVNYDPQTFAMCCNNLARELRLHGEHEKAIAICTDGIEQYYFMVILQNRFGAYIDAGQLENALIDGKRLIEEFGDEMDLITYFTTIDNICSCQMELKLYEEALQWLNAGLETYYELDSTDPITHDSEVVRCFTNFFIHKANAESALGIQPEVGIASEGTDRLLEQMPDNPSLLISRANTFIDAGDFAKAMECYQYALHFASEKGQERSIQVALYNMGYLQVAHLNDSEAACASFEQSITSGNPDFWCYYWATHCTYHLAENEKTLYYGDGALKALPQQENVTEDIIAELYEHMGTTCLDLQRYDDAITYLQQSLAFQDMPITRANLKVAEATKQRSKGFFYKLFNK